MVPAELPPSPQTTVAEYSAAVAKVSPSVKVATVAVKDFPSVAEMLLPVAVIDRSEIARSTWKLNPLKVFNVFVVFSQKPPLAANLNEYGLDPENVPWLTRVPSG